MYALYASAWPDALADLTTAGERADRVARYDARIAREASNGLASADRPAMAIPSLARAARVIGPAQPDCTACPA
jgi:hypothetical protein